MQQHLIAVPLPQIGPSTCRFTTHTHTHKQSKAKRASVLVDSVCRESNPAEIYAVAFSFFTHQHSSLPPKPQTSKQTTYRAKPQGINSLLRRYVCQAWPGVPFARGAPHAAMRCQRTLAMASICSVAYIGRTLLPFSPQQCEPRRMVTNADLGLASGFPLPCVPRRVLD